MTLAEKQDQLAAQLAAFKNAQDGLGFLVERAKKRPSLPPGFRVEKNLVPGCLAKLWFVENFCDGKCFFDCDSDSLIVKAVGGLLCDFYSGSLPVEILAHDPKFLVPFGITQHLTPNRRNALSSVWKKIQTFAQAAGK